MNSILIEDLPLISIVIPTYNSERTLVQCLESIANQDYPREKIEIIITDGGSTDSSADIARSFNAKLIVSRRDQQNQERRKALGLMKAKGEIVAYIDSDNILPHEKWLRVMIKPFSENEKLVATQPLRYTYKKSDAMLNRYFALFGVNDPVVYYLGKRDRLSWVEDSWRLPGLAIDKGYYFLVRFEPDDLPTLGANGYLVKRKILLKAKCDPSDFFHIDVNYDLVKLGYDIFGIVKTDIIHLTGNTFFSFLRKRLVYMIQYYLNNQSARRYKMYVHSRDKRKLAMFILSALTFLKPVYDCIRGYKKIQDVAWFLHPIMSICVLFAYGFATIERNLHK